MVLKITLGLLVIPNILFEPVLGHFSSLPQIALIAVILLFQPLHFLLQGARALFGRNEVLGQCGLFSVEPLVFLVECLNGLSEDGNLLDFLLVLPLEPIELVFGLGQLPIFKHHISHVLLHFGDGFVFGLYLNDSPVDLQLGKWVTIVGMD